MRASTLIGWAMVALGGLTSLAAAVLWFAAVPEMDAILALSAVHTTVFMGLTGLVIARVGGLVLALRSIVDQS